MHPIDSPITYPPVSTEEVAFAIAIFVNAANRTISRIPRPPLSSRARRACDQAFLDLVPRSSSRNETTSPGQASLYEAFKVLWEQFEGDNQQTAVCARILAFHFLMERTRGSVIEEWLMEHSEQPETVILDDAIVAAIASTTLSEDGSLQASQFRSAVSNHIQERSKTAHSLAVITRDLAAQLLTLESRASATENGDPAVSSQICQKLLHCLGPVEGRGAYRILLLRALVVAAKEEASLATVRIREDGTLEGAGDASIQAGQVLIARFVELQALFIGETLLLNLLRASWPGLSSVDDPAK